MTWTTIGELIEAVYAEALFDLLDERRARVAAAEIVTLSRQQTFQQVLKRTACGGTVSVAPDKKAEYGFYVDPGTRSAGCALFKGDELIRVAVAKRPAAAPSGPQEARKWAVRLGQEMVDNACRWIPPEAAVRVVVEFQQIYTHGAQRTKNAKSVLVLTLQTGGVLMALQQRVEVSSWDVREPAVWKGNVSVPIQKDRTQRQLSEKERSCFEHLGRSKNNDDVWVAVGIGLHDVGRRLA